MVKKGGQRRKSIEGKEKGVKKAIIRGYQKDKNGDQSNEIMQMRVEIDAIKKKD